MYGIILIRIGGIELDEKLMEFLSERFDNLEQSIKSQLEMTRAELKTENQCIRNESVAIQKLQDEVKKLRNDITTIEAITKENLYAIAKIKAIGR